MIKPSSSAPASPVPPRRPTAAEAEPRSTNSEGDGPAFAKVMGAQESLADEDTGADGTRVYDDSRDGADDLSAVSEAAPSCGVPTPAAAPRDATAPVVDAMFSLCSSQAAAAPVPGTALEVTAGAACLRSDEPTDDLKGRAAAVPGEGRTAHAMLDGGLRKRLALGSSLVLAQASGVAPQTENAARDNSADQAAIGPTGAGAAGAVGEARAAGRPLPAPAATAPAPPPELRAPLGTAAWTDELGARLTWLVDRGDQVASLRLSPENLGPLEVRIAVREGETSIWFGAANADTRAALEQSLPRLKEMLGASGLSLANAGVFSHTPRDPQRGFTAAALARASQESGTEVAGEVAMQVSRRGLVDLYA